MIDTVGCVSYQYYEDTKNKMRGMIIGIGITTVWEVGGEGRSNS